MTEPLTPHLPNLSEVREWDRDHRRECQERHCTLDHRMLAFADWYIVIERGWRERVEQEAVTRVLDALAGPLKDEDEIAHGEAVVERNGRLLEMNVCAYCQSEWPCRTQRGIDRLLAAIDTLMGDDDGR